MLDHGLILEIGKDLGYGCDLRGAIGEGSTRRIRLIALGGLLLSGIALQGLVLWYGVQTTREEWDAAAVRVWPFPIGIWILPVVLGLALLRKRLKDMQKGLGLGE